MSAPAVDRAAPATRSAAPPQGVVVAGLGIAQILAWGSSYYLLTVLAKTIAADTGWSLPWVVGGLSLGMLVQGLVAPYVGSAIERHGGRPVLAASAMLLAAGLLILGLAPSLPVYLAAWGLLGLGMAAGLYDAAFSTLGRLFGREARRAITLLTLFGGFASTLCWPLAGVLMSEVGWRGTCLVYAVLQLGLALPIYLLAIPRGQERPADIQPAGGLPASGHGPRQGGPPGRGVHVLMALTFTICSFLAGVISVHLFNLLQARGMPFAAAVAAGTLIGPAQVGGRLVEMFLGKHLHPIRAKMASAGLIAIGLVALSAGLPITSLALILYGAGMGIKSIARGTLPLAIFGPAGYATLMGRLAVPNVIAGAAAPSLGALLIGSVGAAGTLAVLAVLAAVNLCVVGILWGRLPARAG